MYKLLFFIIISTFSLFSSTAISAMPDLVMELLKAVQQNDIKAVREHIRRGMSVDTSDEVGNTLLMRASKEGHPDMVRALLDMNAAVKKRNSGGDTPLMFGALGGNMEIVRLLVDAGAELEHPGWAPIHYCAWAGKTNVCQYLISLGVDIDAKSPNGTTALMMAVRGGHLDTVKLLVWEVAELDVTNDDGATALQWAHRSNRQDIISRLKQAGARK